MVTYQVHKGEQWKICVCNHCLEMEICDEGKEKIGFACNPNYLTRPVSFCKGNLFYKQALLEANCVMFKLNE